MTYESRLLAGVLLHAELHRVPVIDGGAGHLVKPEEPVSLRFVSPRQLRLRRREVATQQRGALILELLHRRAR